MEFRKLMAFGNSSYIVTVPKAWVQKNRLNKGDMLLIEQKPTELIISSKDESERRKINRVTVNPEGKTDEEFKTEITSLYVNNYDVIAVINVKDPNQVKAIFRNLAGMEIVEETVTKIVAKDLLDVQEVSLDNVIRRIDLMALSMLLDSAQLDLKNCDSVVGRDVEVNRLSLLGFRAARAATDNPRLLKLFDTTYWNVMLAKQTIGYLERFADQVKRIIRTAKETEVDGKLKIGVLKLIEKLICNYKAVMKIYHEKNREAAFKAETMIRAMFKDCHMLLQHNPNVTAAKFVEYFEYAVGSMKGILRIVMECEQT